MAAPLALVRGTPVGKHCLRVSKIYGICFKYCSLQWISIYQFFGENAKTLFHLETVLLRKIWVGEKKLIDLILASVKVKSNIKSLNIRKLGQIKFYKKQLLIILASSLLWLRISVVFCILKISISPKIFHLFFGLHLTVNLSHVASELYSRSVVLNLFCQFRQHFTSSYCINFLLPKSYKLKLQAQKSWVKHFMSKSFS